MRTLTERKALLARLPWVTRLPSSSPEHRCEGIKWSHLSLTAMRAWRRDEAPLPERAHCKRRGWYRFIALKPRGKYPPHPATSGVYCYDHLAMQIGDHEKEHARLLAWLEQNAPDWL